MPTDKPGPDETILKGHPLIQINPKAFFQKKKLSNVVKYKTHFHCEKCNEMHTVCLKRSYVVALGTGLLSREDAEAWMGGKLLYAKNTGR